MRAALLFAGQGAEEPRMGLELAERSTEAAALLELAGDLTRTDWKQVLRRGGRAMSRTEILQPMIAAVSLGALAVLRERGVEIALAAGHSLGELAAWAAVGGIAAEDAVTAAAARGRIMAEVAATAPGGMLALTGADEAAATAAIERGRRVGIVDLAAHNAPDEWVLTGDEAGLRAVAGLGTRLRVAGPWHSRLMSPAEAPLREVLAGRSVRRLEAPLLLNGTGSPAVVDEDIGARIAEQTTRPIRWAATLAALPGLGITDIVTVGPGRVMRALVRRNLQDRIRVHTTRELTR